MATFTTITGGGARLASAGSSWVGGTPPDFTGAAKDVIVVAVGTTLTQDVDARWGNKGAAAGHAFRVNGTSATSYGEYVVPSGVTLTLEGLDTGANTLGFTQQFARFTVRDGATVKYDVAAGGASCLDLRGITDVDAATFDAAAGVLNWANAGSGTAANFSGQYDRDRNVQCYDLGRRWLANAGGTALGTSGDSSVAFTGVSPAGILATHVASIEACDGAGKYFVDHEVGVVYFHNTAAAFSFSATYKYLTYPDVGIRAIQNTSHNELTVDGATFNYWGANGAAEEYLLNAQNKSAASLAGDRRLFRAANVTFNFCKRLCGLKNVNGTAADMVLLTGWRVRAYANGNNFGPVLSLYRTNTSYVKFSDCSGNGYEHPWLARVATAVVHDHLLFEHQAWESVGLFEAGGASANPLLITYPDSTIDGVFHRGVGSAINSGIDNRTVSGFGGVAGRPTRLTSSVFWRSMRWLNLAPYQTVSDCVLGHTYHHGINGPATLSDVHVPGVEVRRHLNVECDNGGFVELGYNRRQFLDGPVIEHCTVYHNRAGASGTINAAFTFGDLGDNIGPQLVTGLVFRSNLLEANGTGVRRGADIAANMLRLGIAAADHNCVHGSTAADFAGTFARFATFTHAGGAEYNVDAARGCRGLTLHNPSTAAVAESTARSLAFTRTSPTDRTVAWGSGAPQQLVQDGGTASGATNAVNNGTLADASKAWPTAQNNPATPIGTWVEITGGTGAGQVRRVTNATATSVTVVPAWATTPDATSTYVLIRSEIRGLSDGATTVDVGVDARSLPPASATDTGIGVALRGLSVDPAFTAPSRDLRSWDTTQGGPGTETHAVALLRATPTLVKSSLYPYLMAGFTPTAAALRTAGHDGTAIGALPMAPGTTPTIALSPTSLSFAATAGGPAPAAQTVAVTNAGTGTLDQLSQSITYGGGATGWLTAAFVGGTTAPTSLQVSANPAGLAAGTYTATIAVSSAAAGVTNSPQNVQVSFTVAAAAAPAIALSPTSLSFGATAGGSAPAPQTVAVTNGGTGTLDQLALAISYGTGAPGWLTAAFVGGTTAPTSIQATANPAGLAAGTYTATIAVSSTAAGVTNSPQSVSVTFTVAAAPAPTIALSPTSLAFSATAGGAAPAAQSVSITNGGTGTLDQLSSSIAYGGSATGWLSATFVGGTTAPTSLQVTVDTTGVAAGTHTATIAVSSAAAGVTNSPQNVQVTLTVAAAPAPTIALSPTALSFGATAGGAAPASQSVAITNAGTGTLDGLAQSISYGGGATGWLTATFAGGTTAPTSLDVTANPAGLAAGTYSATIAISSSAAGVTNSPQNVSVTFTVAAAPAPTIALSPTSLAFSATAGGTAPAPQSVAVTNGGTGTLDQLSSSISYGAGAPGWLAATFVGGTTAPTSLQVTADPTGLAAGTYTATVAVSSAAAGVTNSPQSVQVSFTVAAAPAPTIALSPTTLSFGATAGGAAPAAQTVAVTNAGTGTLDQLTRTISYGTGAPGWLTATFVGGTAAPTSLQVTASPAGLAAGTYTATIAVSSTAAGVTNSPQTVSVTLTVTAAGAPTIALAPTAVTIEGTVGGSAPAPQSVAITNAGTGTLDGLARTITYAGGVTGWLTATFVGGTTAPTSLQLTATPGSLPLGTYRATVAVSSTAAGVTNSPQLVEVTFRVRRR